MTTVSSSLVCITLMFVWVLETCYAHSWLRVPQGRETASPILFDDGTKSCPSGIAREPIDCKAGELLDVRYPRNRRTGGFVRWAIVPWGSESTENLDANVFAYTCFESGEQCIPKDDPEEDNLVFCGDKVKLPDWLPDGAYVLQMTAFGVAATSGSLVWSEQYRACTDLRLTMGRPNAKKQQPCPRFTGGDYRRKMYRKAGNVCYYFHSNAIETEQYADDMSNATVRQNEFQFGVPDRIAMCQAAKIPFESDPETIPPSEGFGPIIDFAAADILPGAVFAASEPTPSSPTRDQPSSPSSNATDRL